MFRFFRHRSIKSKLTLLMMLISTVLLLIVSGVVLVSEYFQSRAILMQEMRVLSSALVANARQALVLGKYSEVEKVLGALSTQRHIHAAYFFDQQGKPVVQYLVQKNAGLVWSALETDFYGDHGLYRPTALTEQVRYSTNHFGLFTPVFYNNKQVGTLYLLSDLSSVKGRLGAVAFAVTISLFLLFACSWWLAGRLQKPVSEPILELSRVMKSISENKKYSLRASKSSHDEIGVLVDIFNQMLSQIETHLHQQQQYQQNLELTVEQRTNELRSTIGELQLAREQADAANAAKSLFLSRMTHELRTPLIGVLGMNGLLLRTSLTEQQKMLVDIANKSGEDLLALISDVLDVSRIEAGKLKLETAEVDICQVIEESAELLFPQAHDKGLQLLLDIPMDALWTVRADRAKIVQIMMNLIGNAIKFTSSGSITVRLHSAPRAEDTMTFRIDVEDTGVGMNETDSQRVFELFYQLDNQPTEARVGSGLGLAIVKQLVDLMNGSLHLSSVPGVGSAFQIELVCPVIARRSLPVLTEFAGRRLLLGIESQEQAQLLRRRLQDIGFEVETATAADMDSQRHVSLADDAHSLLIVDAQWLAGSDMKISGRNLNIPMLLLSADRGIDRSADHSLPVLHLPVTWDRLFTALHSLPDHIEADVVTAVSVPAYQHQRVLFVGRHAAMRQLLRLSLSRWRLDLDCIDDLSLLQNHKQQNQYLLMLIDVADFSQKALKEALTATTWSPATCYLLGDDDFSTDDNGIMALCSGYLQKPLSDDVLAAVIKGLLTDAEPSLEQSCGAEIFSR